jgi:hypothetical protein
VKDPRKHSAWGSRQYVDFDAPSEDALEDLVEGWTLGDGDAEVVKASNGGGGNKKKRKKKSKKSKNGVVQEQAEEEEGDEVVEAQS